MLAQPQIVRPHAAAPPIRLLIVDDSIVARTVMARILSARPEFEVVATASHAAHAIEVVAKTHVDIVLLDVEMPGRDGLSALPELLASGGGARVLMVSACTADGAAATVRALTQGAADTLLKPGAAGFAGRFAEDLVDRLLRIGHATRKAGAAVQPARCRDDRPARSRAIECIAIGSSTGGPHACTALLTALPADMRVPMLVTQHLPVSFMPHFARQLQDIAGRPVRVAEEGARLQAGEILVAPGDGHIRLRRMAGGALGISIDRSQAVSGCMPSVDPMLASAAGLLGPALMAVVLSGMGRDGLIGARMLAASGAEILVQDAETSVVWGMPGAIAKAGLASAILPPSAIARRIAERCRPAAGASPWR